MNNANAYDLLQASRFWPDRSYKGQRHIFMCRYCPTAYAQPSKLIIHQRKKHEKELNAHRD